ncbi:ROK family transcriptional regulator [Aestuariimicrobium soli]|uniref:ROK family transcriptional regulator n=1 Tax=Aestuariimicrobium soli TaxID=2035834 RepID=UPI003EBC5E0E
MSEGASQATLRELNLASVAKVLFAHAPLSRAEVATRTGLTRSTVSRLVDELIANGVVVDQLPSGGGGRGRPAVPITPAAATWLGLGLEVNIGHLAARLLDLTGAVVAEHVLTADLTGSDPHRTLTSLARAGADLLRQAPSTARVVGARLALPGLVDSAQGILLRAPNLGWRMVPAGSVVAEALGGDVGVRVGNEADFAALTVAREAPGRPSGHTDFLYVSGEVGIGSALIRGSEWVGGRHGWAGEIGHICVDPGGLPCGCGARGCLETVAGQRALHRAAGVTDHAALVTALAAGDPRAHEAVTDAGRALGLALAGALNLLDVSVIVLGGHLGALADDLMPTLSDELATRVLAAPFEHPTIESVVVDNAPAASGAAHAALEAVLADPASWWVHA